jgi:hypothetical protein
VNGKTYQEQMIAKATNYLNSNNINNPETK